jgi:hypothetical protein
MVSAGLVKKARLCCRGGLNSITDSSEPELLEQQVREQQVREQLE